MKTIVILFVILIIIVIAGAVGQNYLKTNSFPFGKTPKAVVNNNTFNLLLAKSDKETQIGLSEKKSLDENTGMLFVFSKPGYYSFWMKNMKFPIDIIYIKNNKIVTIHENVQPPRSVEESLQIYKPEEPADKVLEINAGLSKKHNIKKGNDIRIEGI